MVIPNTQKDSLYTKTASNETLLTFASFLRSAALISGSSSSSSPADTKYNVDKIACTLVVLNLFLET